MELSYHGLTSEEAKRILSEQGLNVLPEKPQTPLFQVFLRQFESFLVVLLLFAAAFSFVLRDFLDGVLVLLIVLGNATIGFFQEVKAKREVELLANMIVPETRVVRDGQETTIPSRFLVISDLVILTSGDKIPADGEIISAREVTVDESSLSGESVPVVKDKGDEGLMGTTMLSGHAMMKVVRTGEKARFGEIAKSLDSIVEEKTPLEVRLERFGKMMGLLVIGVIGVLFLTGLSQGREVTELFFTSTALAVAAVPEGLPAVLTIALTVGVSRLAKRKAIVKRLVSAETLGSVDVICTDKTGTLTRNQMMVVGIFPKEGNERTVSGIGYSDEGEISNGVSGLSEILKAGVLCNSSSLAPEEDGGRRYRVLGDTTEGALLILAKKGGVDFEMVRRENPILEEIPFDSERKMMTVMVSDGGYTKGAPEEVIERSNNLDELQREALLNQARVLGAKGLRVLAVAKKKRTEGLRREDLEKDLTYLGILTISDPPREEVGRSLQICREMGISVVMITGDSVETARAIAEQVDIIEEGEEVVSGSQMQEYSDEVLSRNLQNIKVFARVKPLDKLRIVESLRRMGKVVAVTGDGVNDAPAIKQSDVGVAMGITGTDVAKEASDLVITDDNFATIVAAVVEGRIIFANLVKSIKYLLAANLGEVVTVCTAIVFGWGIPLSPLALLWINLVGDGLPALALAVDSHDGQSIRKKYLKGKDFLFRGDVLFIVTIGVIQAALVLTVFYWFSFLGKDQGRLAAFTVMVVLEAAVAILVRGKRNPLSNKYLIWAIVVTLIAQMVILLIPGFRMVFV